MRGEDLTWEDAKRLAKEIIDLKPPYITLDGGEPLMRNDLFDLLELFADGGLKTYLITNGTKLDDQIIERLSNLGVKLMISIDGATKNTYEGIRKGANFEYVIRQAKSCGEHQILKAILTTMMRPNFRELPKLIEEARNDGADQIIFIGLKPVRKASYKDLLLRPQEYLEAFRSIVDSKGELEMYVDEPFFIPVVKELGLSWDEGWSETGIVSGQDFGCIFGRYLFIEPNGEVKPCTFSPISYGNIKDRPLVEIWKDMKSSDFLHKIWNSASRKGKCKTCKYLEECRGCRSRTFAMTGDWFEADPACPISIQ
jgi:radical SAM protein with 4Fe4S-binding SPASM domain